MEKTPSIKTQQAVASSASNDEPAVVSTDPAQALLAAPHPTGGAQETTIAVAAYYRAERRGFAPGHELEDWLAAEAEITASSLQQAAAPAELH
jgi:hypothetical protein